MERVDWSEEDNLMAVHSRLSYKRTIRVMCFLLVLGLILLAVGLASRTVLNRGVSSMLSSELLTSDAESAEKLDALARDGSVKMVSALVQNDYDGFFSANAQIPDDIYDLIGNPNTKDNLVGYFFRAARNRNLDVARFARETMISTVGSYWFALQAAIYYKEMMITGAALIVISLLGIFMKGARFRDLRFSKCWPILLVLLVCVAGVIIAGKIDIKL